MMIDIKEILDKVEGALHILNPLAICDIEQIDQAIMLLDDFITFNNL